MILFIFLYIIVMPSSFLVFCFVKDITTIVNHKLILYSMSFLFASRIVPLSSILIYRSWNLLFCTICERQKAWKILFNFLWRFQPLCNVICFLWNWYTLSYQIFNLLYISAYVALIQIKEKSS